MKITKYPDGGKYVVADIPQNKELIYRIDSYEDLFLLSSFVDSYRSQYSENDLTLFIPCMFQQQHDRRFEKESFELKLVCDFINRLNFKKVKVYHPHSDVTPALLNNCEIIDNSEFILKSLFKIYPSKPLVSNFKDNIILMSSDAGGFKSLMKLCDKIKWEGEVYSANKSRKYQDGKSILTQIVDRKDFEKKDILIVDDICVYGGTFVGLAKMLRERNIGKLYLAVSHITVEAPNPELFTLFDKVFTTNSKGLHYVNSNQNRPKNLEIINSF